MSDSHRAALASQRGVSELFERSTDLLQESGGPTAVLPCVAHPVGDHQRPKSGSRRRRTPDVHDSRGRFEANLETVRPEPPAKIDVLSVVEERLVPAVELLECLTPNEHTCSGYPLDGLPSLVCRCSSHVLVG